MHIVHSNIWVISLWLVFSFAVRNSFDNNFFHHIQCSGPSMEPTLYTNNLLLTERVSRRMNGLERGDIVIAKSPNKPEQLICKRIVGMPGDKIHIKPRFNLNPFDNAKSIIITEEEEEESGDDKSDHLTNQESKMRNFHYKEVFVPRGHVWLEGDNYENSSDSRIYGPVPLGLIQSRIVMRIWPLNEVKLFVLK